MERLDPYFVSYNKIDKESIYNCFYMKPEDLVNQRRVDILVKYYYIKAVETGENLEFAKKIYIAHIEAFSDGTFYEHGNKDKDSIEKYIETFNSLIENFKESGFDERVSTIPIGKHGEILDGSHRVACALYFKQQVKVMEFKDLSVDYGFEFFRKRLLDEFYLDFIAKEYVNLKKQVYALFAWPRIGNEENIEYIERDLKKDKFNIIYKKKLKLDKKGLWNLIFNIYKDEYWVKNSDDDFKLINEKRDLCYDEEGLLYVYILDSTRVEALSQKKENLRHYFGVEKASIHTTDTYEESIEILDVILDKDYDKILYENFLKNREIHNTSLRRIKRKIRYIYRKLLNTLKRILGKPV